MNSTIEAVQLGATRRGTSPSIAISLYALMAIIVFAAYATQIFNLFFFYGANSADAGWFAYLMSRFDVVASNPLYIQEIGISSFYSFHLCPIMPLWGAVAQAAGWSPAVAFAVFQGFFHGLLAICGAGLATTALPPPWNLAFRLFVGLSLAFSPIALNAISFAHHELAIPILFIATCYAISQHRRILAWTLFVLLLLVRTDAGFHACAFLGAFAAAEFIRTRGLSPAAKRAATFAAIGFAYSVAAFLIVKYAFPAYDNLRSSYLGPEGYFRHVNASFLAERVWVLLQKRPEIFVLLAFVTGLGTWKRDLSILAGVVAILPWTILHLAAYRSIPGELYTYYAFPYLIFTAWPFLVPALRKDQTAGDAMLDKGFALAWVSMVVIGVAVYFTTPFASDSLTSAGRVSSAGSFIPKVNYVDATTVSKFARAYAKAPKLPINLVLMDEPMISLLPDTSRNNLFRENANQIPAANESFVVAYFHTYMHAAAVENRYAAIATTCYEVKGTNIRLLARGNEDLLKSNFGDFLSSFDCNQVVR